MAESNEDGPTPAKRLAPNTNTASSTTQENLNKHKQLVRMFCMNLRPLNMLEDNDFRKFMKNIANYDVPSKEKICGEVIPEEFTRAKSELLKIFELVHHIAISIEKWKWGVTSERNMLTATAHFVQQSKLISQILFTTEVKLWEETFIITAIKHGLEDWNIFKKVVCITASNRNNEAPLRFAVYAMGIPHFFCLDDTITANVEEIFGILNLKQNKSEKDDSDSLINNNKDETFNWHEQYMLLKHVTENNSGEFTEDERKSLGECFQMLKPYEDLNKLSYQHYLTLSSIYPLYLGIIITTLHCVPYTPKAKDIQKKITGTFIVTENDVALKAAFLDPRFKPAVLENSMSEKVQSEVESELNEVILNNQHNMPVAANSKNLTEENKSLLDYVTDNSKNTADTDTSSRAKIMISQYVQMPDLLPDENPFQFWEDFHRIYKDNELYMLAQKYLCIPATSIRAESFSGEFPWMKSFRDSTKFYERRNLLEYENINEILFLHSYYSRNQE